ncbi:MAG: aminotransferase class III-fold pyridoxal phosphate-dependent enzyme [Anoxybacillus gonensis]|nr:aminotransferase class III-fold pyridoxal phosphate-dependent enzyme [Anoxybacillus gonensis]
MGEEQRNVRARRLGEKKITLLKEMKQQFDIVGDVRGLGAMCAIELVTDREQKTPAKEQTAYIVSQAWKRGAIFLSAGLYSNVVRFLPPLVMTDEQLERGFSVLRQLLAEVQQKVVK